MEVTATTKFVRLSPDKGRDLIRLMRGLPVSDALKLAQFSSRKAAQYIGRTLKSAVANAQKNKDVSVDKLRVKEAVIQDGPRLKRFWQRARGGASPILKRTCHVRVVLTDN